MSDRKVFSLRDGLRDLFVRPAFHEPVIDGVRAIAVLWVLLFHCWFFQSPHWTNGISVPMFDVINSSAGWTWLKEGQFGVDFFFVISGFLIGTILFKELARTDTLNLKRFYARRFLRLIPVYVAAMAIGYFCGLKNAETAWANLLYVNNFLPIDQQYMGWCWSLAIEEQFYCVAPLLLLFAWKRRGGFLVGSAVLLVLGWGIRLYVTHASGLEFLYEWPDIQTDNPGWVRRFSVVYDNFYTRYGGLLIGVMAAWMHTKHGGALARFFEARSALATVLTLAGVGGILFISGVDQRFTMDKSLAVRMAHFATYRDVLALCLAWIILAGVHGRFALARGVRRVLGAKALYPIAQLSYSSYLMHEIWMVLFFPTTTPKFIEWFGADAAFWVNSLFAIVLTLLSSAVLYLTIERPCMKMRRG